MNLSQQEILDLMVAILGGDVDEADGWISTGNMNRRNTLNTDERIVNKAINYINTELITGISTVNDFGTRINTVVGDEATVDKDAFEDIGTNLIQAVLNLQQNGGCNLVPMTNQEIDEVFDEVFGI